MSVFKFKQFEIQQDRCAMKIGTDSVLLGAWADLKIAKSILDIGSGTGVLSLMAAQRNANATILGIEIDKEAVHQSLLNVRNSAWTNRVNIAHQSIQKMSALQQFDYIITNPPYFPAKANTLAVESKRQQARATVKLSFDELIDKVGKLLNAEKGIFGCILPAIEGQLFITKLRKTGFFLKRITEVIPRKGHTAPNRLLIEATVYPIDETHQNQLVIRNEGTGYHDYTQSYIDLVRDFYTIF